MRAETRRRTAGNKNTKGCYRPWIIRDTIVETHLIPLAHYPPMFAQVYPCRVGTADNIFQSKMNWNILTLYKMK